MRGKAVIESLKAGWIWLFVGAIAGAFIPADGLRRVIADLPGLAAASTSEADAEDAADDEHEDHVLITEFAARNLKLRTGRVQSAPFTRQIRIPGTVRERTALSDLAVSSRVQGVVSEVYTQPGQAVRLGQPLFRIELTGEELARAQSSLLDAIQRTDTAAKELKRLQTAADVGGVPANKLQQLKYDQQRFELEQENRRQELLIRGLTEEQVAEIVDSGKLIREVVVRMPAELEDTAPTSPRDGEVSFDDGLGFTIEDLHVHPGKAVRPTDRLCDVAYHTNLYFEGQAFEKDVDLIRAITQDDRRVGIEFGTEQEPTHVANLRIIYIDNHVDPETQTFRFYIPIHNEVMGDVRDGDVVFRSWRFKPGQRGHVTVPVEQLTGHFPLPREAVFIDGPDAFVFRRLPDDHVHSEEENADHDHDHSRDKEYEAVPVHVIFTDERTTVVAANDELQAGDRIAINRAHDLYLAMKSGDGAHAHVHPH